MHGHKAGCDCNYCEHVKHCVLIHNKLVEALELALKTSEQQAVEHNHSMNFETHKLYKTINKALSKAKAK